MSKQEQIQKTLEKQARIKKLYYEDNLFYSEIGKLFGVSRQRIHQIIHYVPSLPKLPKLSTREKIGKFKPYLKPVETLTGWTARKRKALGLSDEKITVTGGLSFIRELVRIRDSRTCQDCGKVWEQGKRRFDVHHLDPKMESIRDIKYDRANMDKMITLCHKCHMSKHAGFVKQKQLINSKPLTPLTT